MTYANFKQLILNYTGVATGAYDRNGVDALLNAVNNMRQEACRLHDFSFLKVRGYLQLGSGSSTVWTTIKPNEDLSGASITLARLKSVHDLAVPGFQREVAIISDDNVGNLQLNEPTLSVAGDSLYHGTDFAGLVVGVRGVKVLPDLVGDETDDIFLSRYNDWLQLAVFNHMNFYLNEQSRVQISVSYMRERFRSMLADDIQRDRGGVNY